MTKARLLFAVALLTLLSCHPVFGQDSISKSVLAFELKPRQLSEHPLVRLAAKNAKPEAKRLAKAERILGFVSLPKEPKQLQDLDLTGAIPFDFVVTIEFANKSDRLALIGENELQFLERVSNKGKTFYTYPSDNSNLVLIVEDLRIDFGTSNYLSLTDRNVATEELSKFFGAIRPAPIRVAADLSGCRTFINKSLDMAAGRKPPAWAVPFMDVPRRSNAMTISVDLTANNLLQFESFSDRESDAQFVAKAIKAVIGLAQVGIKEDKKAAALGQALLAAASIEVQDKMAIVSLSKPERLDDLILKLVQSQAR